MRQRADFLAAARGVKVATPPFVVQALKRREGGPPRVGFTVSKKVGNAVERNRVRRRLRELVRLRGEGMLPGFDYVFIGRGAALSTPFAAISNEFDKALRRVHEKRVDGRQPGSGRGGTTPHRERSSGRPGP
jgi:ribonuclease P protein component